MLSYCIYPIAEVLIKGYVILTSKRCYCDFLKKSAVVVALAMK